MELVAIIRVLLGHKLAMALGAAVALLVGLVAAGQLTLMPPGIGSGTPGGATAVSRVQLDAPHPLVAEKRVKGDETITPRTRVFALLMSENRISRAIGRRAGLDPGVVSVVNAGAEAPLEVTPLASEAAAATAVREGHVVTVSADPQVPMISLVATAPDEASAVKLAGAATEELVVLVERIAPGGGHRYVLAKPLGAPLVELEPGGVRWHIGLAAAAIVFVLWCSAIVLASGAMRAWRAGGRRGGRPQEFAQQS